MNWLPKVGEMVLVTDIAAVHNVSEEEWCRLATRFGWVKRGQIVTITGMGNGIVQAHYTIHTWYRFVKGNICSFAPLSNKKGPYSHYLMMSNQRCQTP